jgi:hypothetical protein
MMTDTLVERLTNEIVETERLGFDASFYRDIKAEVEAQANQIAELREAAERGLEWAIDAANEINDANNGVFQNAMKDISFIEKALADNQKEIGR